MEVYFMLENLNYANDITLLTNTHQHIQNKINTLKYSQQTSTTEVHYQKIRNNESDHKQTAVKINDQNSVEINAITYLEEQTHTYKKPFINWRRIWKSFQ